MSHCKPSKVLEWTKSTAFCGLQLSYVALKLKVDMWQNVHKSSRVAELAELDKLAYETPTTAFVIAAAGAIQAPTTWSEHTWTESAASQKAQLWSSLAE